MDYEQDMKIDETALDVECLDQASLMMKYCRISAEADQEVDLAKEALDLQEALLDTAIRANPQKFSINKLTEAGVANTILIQESYKEASARLIQAKFESKIASGAVKALEHRKNMLETLVKLHGQQYFAGPSLPRDLGREWERKQEQKKADEKIIIRRNRKEE